MSKPKLCLAATSSMTFATLLEGQPRYLSRFYDVSMVCGADARFLDRVQQQERMRPHVVPFTRQITPQTDLKALGQLVAYFRRTRPDIVQTYTPKAGLIGMMAARLAGVPIRVHGVVGMPLMEASGSRAAILHVTERLTYANATHLTSNSTGLREWIWQHLTRRPITVPGHGSINGVDVERFDDDGSDEDKAHLRDDLGIGRDQLVFLFVGRVVRDKGIEELVTAFTRLSDDHPSARLLLVGDYEPELDPVSPEVDEAIRTHPMLVKTGFVSDVRRYMAISDAFVLPSYREGLPNSLIEAGAMGLPSIATDINGCNEVIVPGENGVLVPAKDPQALEHEMRRMLDDPAHRAALRAASRPSVVRRYSQDILWPELHRLYQRLLGEAGQAGRVGVGRERPPSQ